MSARAESGAGVGGSERDFREAVGAGLGLTLLPDWLMDEALRSGSLVRVLPRWRAKPLPVHGPSTRGSVCFRRV